MGSRVTLVVRTTNTSSKSCVFYQEMNKEEMRRREAQSEGLACNIRVVRVKRQMMETKLA